MLNTPFSPWPSYSDEEAEAVARVLRSNRVNYWTGDECRQFEHEFAEWTGCRHAIALANGSVALELALRALGVGPGDEVIIPPRTFLASASSVVLVGARPVFADIDPISQNLTPETIAAVLTPRTRAIICVHLAGWPCDMDPIMSLALRHNLYVVEDCAQAHGAIYRGRSVGSIGHVGAWSFCQDKIITTGGEGGMVTTQDESLWRLMWAYKDHGKSYEAMYERTHPPGYRWVHESFGSNWRMTEMQAAIGRIQLRRMATWTALRNAHSNRLTEALRPLAGPAGPVRLLEPQCTGCPAGDACNGPSGCVNARYKYYACVRPENFARDWTRDRVIDAITEAGVPCFSGSCSEVYLEKAFEGTGMQPPQRLPVAKLLGETSLMWLVHPTLTSEEIARACHVSAGVLAQAGA
jgi:dTDP-4-amino-4,6-dideoxygalactose transaminase